MVFHHLTRRPRGRLVWVFALFLVAPVFGQDDTGHARWLALTTVPGNDRSIADYAPITDETVRPRLQRVPGVSFVEMIGAEARVEIALDPDRLSSLQRTPADVAAALNEAQVPAWTGASEPTVLSVSLQDLAISPDDLGSLVLWFQPAEDGEPPVIVALGDIATIRPGRDDANGGPFVHGDPAIVLSVHPLPEAAPARLANDLQDAVADLNQRLGLPADLRSMGVTDEMIPPLVPQAMADHTTATNPRPLSEADYTGLFEEAMG